MVNLYQPKVHQKLAHARLLLAMAEECGENLIDRQKSEALLSAAVASLGIAFGLYLKELGANHQLPGLEQIHTLDQLVYALTAADKVDAAVTELEQLMHNSWLGELHTAVHQTQFPTVAGNSPGGVQMISSSAAPELSLNTALIAGYLDQLQQTTDRQRHSNLEY